ncbi:LmbE family N-acetylglucosaminyl deacetylase [Sagittula marina]|uniref:LmbE family N-acetylglucosaminyl deacetylase n=1 Tax=Sagittula marina TaxID=943940 RepID=A0A7W6DS42_9RHOB|nr:PIG-L family deacetylase [Sagittula marina]MBB3987967.1 LmbE family N-acetylglucosaminyl deacetylase [Sagittula marina]
MPELSRGGAVSIVAHQDDDILFMNPDIDASLSAGEANTTIFVTAGDAGLGPAYWGGREEGAKAAYSVMTGVDTWVDEAIQLDINGRSIEVVSSHPEGLSDVRLYFLRLPDGGGSLTPDQEQQLARLEEGTLDTVTAVDGSVTYTRSDLVETLTALLDLHAPTQVRLQIADGDNAAGEHTDHVNVTEFAEEALAGYDADSFTVTQYVQYASKDMPANLSEAEADRALAIMEAYAEHDPGVWESDGTLSQVYLDWTGRQYVDRVTEVDPDTPWTLADPVIEAPDEPADPAEGGGGYEVAGPDGFLFNIGSTGAITPKDWFVPSQSDAWDQNSDYIYEVTRVFVADDGTRTEETLLFETVAEGQLAPVADDPADPDSIPPVPVEPEPGEPDPVDPTMPLGNVVYSLDGEDSFLFTIDANSGEIAPEAWFTPSLDDAWDHDEDHVYQVTRIATDENGTTVTEDLSFETTAEGLVSLTSDAPADPIFNPTPTEPQPDPDPDPAPDSGIDFFSLAGEDSQLFTIDRATGEVDTQDWFTPTRDDAWDRDEDHFYEITRVTHFETGEEAEEPLTFETLADDSFVQVPSEGGAALMALLSLPGDGDLPPDQIEAEMEVMDPIE